MKSLGLSWWYFMDRGSGNHSLDSWGETVGVPKPKVEDWEGLSFEEYKRRCEEDVKINLFMLRDYIFPKIKKIYSKKSEHITAMLRYNTFKMYCLKLQEDNPFRLDIEMTDRKLNWLKEEFESKREKLIEVMPKAPVMRKTSKPQKMYKVDGELSSSGENWFKRLEMVGLPKDHQKPFKYPVKWEPGNPNSHVQVKNWLYSLGWKPKTYSWGKKKGQDPHKIPQVRDGSELCDSVKKLIEKNPTVAELEDYTVIKSRKEDLEGFLKNCKANGDIVASAAAYTNTLRFRHSILVNLPGVTGEEDWADGVHIRGCLKAQEGYVLCGADVSSLEDSTKQHYIYPYDPEYVKEMMDPDFDPHTDVAVRAKVMTEKEKEEHLLYKKTEGEEGVDHSAKRKLGKKVNFSGIYGIGVAKLSDDMGVSEKFARKILDAYWDRNWAVKDLSMDMYTRKITFDGKKETWLYNPVSGFFYPLRADKDVFSTLNQGTGVFVFDTWLKYVLAQYPALTAQFHDEFVIQVPEGEEEKFAEIIKEAMEKTT